MFVTACSTLLATARLRSTFINLPLLLKPNQKTPLVSVSFLRWSLADNIVFVITGPAFSLVLSTQSINYCKSGIDDRKKNIKDLLKI
jgi:hypothetical protein